MNREDKSSLLDLTNEVKRFEIFADNYIKVNMVWRHRASGTKFLLAGWFYGRSAGAKGK